MHARWTSVLAAMAVAAGCATVSGPPADETAAAVAPATETSMDRPSFSGEMLKAHMAWLADDARMGREAGTPGYDEAAAYVALQYEAVGLQPLADGTYFQEVPLRVFKHLESEASWWGANGAPVDSDNQVIVYPSSAATESSVSAPVVFAGFGVVDEPRGRDDFAGLDVDGKIVAVLYGAPRSYQSEERAHYSSSATKGKAAAERGAVGLITLYTPEFAKRFGFERARYALMESKRMTWLNENGEAHTSAPGIEAAGLMSMDGARAFLADGGMDYDALIAASESDDGVVPGGDLALTMSLQVKSTHEDLTSPNVVGVLPGLDPALADEVVVLSAHLDHIGANGPAIDGDTINNGAMDNAAGTSALIEVARAAVRAGGFRRTVVFVALTAEEKGLVGADYFVRTPPIDGTMVANVNLDMPILTYDFVDVIAFGAERSTLEPMVRRAAGRLDVELSPDPNPSQALFTRSDHYRFVQGGVPSVFLVTGYANGGGDATAAFLGERYHRATDEMGDHINFDAAAKFTSVNFEIMRDVANAPDRPVWLAGDFFGLLYDGPMAE